MYTIGIMGIGCNLVENFMCFVFFHFSQAAKHFLYIVLLSNTIEYTCQTRVQRPKSSMCSIISIHDLSPNG